MRKKWKIENGQEVKGFQQAKGVARNKNLQGNCLVFPLLLEAFKCKQSEVPSTLDDEIVKVEAGFNLLPLSPSCSSLRLALRLHIACGDWQQGQVAATIVARTVAVKWKKGQGRGYAPVKQQHCIPPFAHKCISYFHPSQGSGRGGVVQQVGPAGSLITFYWRARTQARAGQLFGLIIS